MERQRAKSATATAEPNKWRLRPAVSIQEIGVIAANEFDCDPLKLGKFVCHTWAESSARAAACIVASEIGHSYERIAEHFGIKSAKYLASVTSNWMSPPLPSQAFERASRVSLIRAIVRERLIEAEGERSQKMQRQSEINRDRNRRVSELRRKGWSVKGIARHFGVDPIEVCDVLGLDRALARVSA